MSSILTACAVYLGAQIALPSHDSCQTPVRVAPAPPPAVSQQDPAPAPTPAAVAPAPAPVQGSAPVPDTKRPTVEPYVTYDTKVVAHDHRHQIPINVNIDHGRRQGTIVGGITTNYERDRLHVTPVYHNADGTVTRGKTTISPLTGTFDRQRTTTVNVGGGALPTVHDRPGRNNSSAHRTGPTGTNLGHK